MYYSTCTHVCAMCWVLCVRQVDPSVLWAAGLRSHAHTQWQGPIVWLPGNELTAVNHNNPSLHQSAIECSALVMMSSHTQAHTCIHTRTCLILFVLTLGFSYMCMSACLSLCVCQCVQSVRGMSGDCYCLAKYCRRECNLFMVSAT